MLPLVARGGTLYPAAMLLAGAFLLYHVRNWQVASKVLASRVVHASVIYLPVVLGMMIAWKA